MASASRHVFLSPHLDDVALSCGASLLRLARSGSAARVVTVFAGGTPPALGASPLARMLFGEEVKPEALACARREEDRAALRLLGASALHLEYPEALFRGTAGERPEWHYPELAALFKGVHPLDEGLCARVAESLCGIIPWDSLVYAPICRAPHVDHRITLLAALRLRQQGYAVACYEDFPYRSGLTTMAGGGRALPAAAQIGLEEAVLEAAQEDLAGKVAALTCYRSQMGALFGGDARMREQVTTQAYLAGEGSPAEKFWLPCGSGNWRRELEGGDSEKSGG